MKINTRFLTITFMIILAMFSRLIPHLPNFQAVSAVALFGAAQYRKKITAFVVPLAALFLSDVIMGKAFYSGWEWIYATFVLITLTGFILQHKISVARIVILSVVSSLLIFIVTDFEVWLTGGIYPHTVAGFTLCYESALPFLRYELLGDLFYSGLLFGAFYLAQLKIPTLQKQRIQQ